MSEFHVNENYQETKWFEIPDDAKLKIVEKLDCASRRALRCCCSKDKQLVELYPFTEEMILKCCFCDDTGSWYIENFSRKGNTIHKKWFEYSENAYEYLRKLLKTAKYIPKLEIDLEPNARIRLRDDRRLTNVTEIILKTIGVNKNCIIDSNTNVLVQLNPSYLMFVSLKLNGVVKSRCVIDAHFYELEKRSFNIQHFSFHGIINDEQLLGLRARFVFLNNCSSITLSGLVRLIQNYVLQTPSNYFLYLSEISLDLELSLFGRFLDLFSSTSSIQLNSRQAGHKILIEAHGPSPACLQIRPARTIRPHGIENRNRQTFAEYPSLRNFVNLVSEGLHPDFQLM